MNTLEINNLSKSFGKQLILNDVSLKCESGDVMGIFGRNGSGKSSLLKLIFGTLKADTIEIRINSENILPKSIISSGKIAYLPQETFLPKGVKVREIIPLFYENDEQDKIFYAPGISKIENTLIGKLSMGELRYLEILLIGNLNHQFIMMDEPFAMVEPLIKEMLKDLLLQLKKTKGILLTDHYYDDVLEITNKNLIVKDGKVLNIECKKDLIKYDYLKSYSDNNK